MGVLAPTRYLLQSDDENTKKEALDLVHCLSETGRCSPPRFSFLQRKRISFVFWNSEGSTDRLCDIHRKRRKYVRESAKRMCMYARGKVHAHDPRFHSFSIHSFSIDWLLAENRELIAEEGCIRSIVRACTLSNRSILLSALRTLENLSDSSGIFPLLYAFTCNRKDLKWSDDQERKKEISAE